MRHLRLVILCTIFLGGAFPSHAQTGIRDQIHARATEAFALSRSEQYDKYLDTVYPAAIQAMGGREKAASMMKQAMDEIKNVGFKFESTNVGEPSEPVAGGSKLFSIVPTDAHIKGPKAEIELWNYLLAVSTDQGKTWKFLDGSGLSQATIQQLIPDFPATLKLPEPKQPKITPVS